MLRCSIEFGCRDVRLSFRVKWKSTGSQVRISYDAEVICAGEFSITSERALSPAELFGGKTPAGA